MIIQLECGKWMDYKTLSNNNILKYTIIKNMAGVGVLYRECNFKLGALP